MFLHVLPEEFTLEYVEFYLWLLLRFELIMVVIVRIAIFSDVKPCGLVECCWSFKTVLLSPRVFFLNMKASGYNITFLHIYQTTRHHVTQDRDWWLLWCYIYIIYYYYYYYYYYFLWLCSPARAMASSFHEVTWSHTTMRHGRTPLDQWSARRRDLYLTTHNRQTSMPPVEFEPTIATGERAVDLLLRPRSHWDQQIQNYMSENLLNHTN
jgi:hypothetical protein